MAKRSSQAVVSQVIKPEPTHEELLAEANKQADYFMNHMKKEAENKIMNIRLMLADESNLLSNRISWKADEIVKAEVQLEMARGYEIMTGYDGSHHYSPWEVIKYLYIDLQRRFLEQMSYGGQDFTACSTSPAHNAMAILRNAAASQVLRQDLSYVRYYAKKLGEQLVEKEN